MSINRCFAVSWALGLVLALAAPAGAEPREPPPHRPPEMRGDGWGFPERSPDELRREILERMQAMRAWKLSEALHPSDALAAKLFPLLSRYDEREMEISKEMGESMRGLRAELEAPKPDNARISGYIDKLLSVRLKQRSLEDEKIKDLRKLLSPIQQAQMVMLLPRIERHIQQRIQEAMEERRHRGLDDF